VKFPFPFNLKRMYFIVKGCSTLFNSLEEANKKALEIANKKLSNNLLTKTTKTVEVVDYDMDGTPYTKYEEVDTHIAKTINSKQELLEMAEEFDYIVSTYVVELFHKEELIQQ
jgi:hypothetical protein